MPNKSKFFSSLKDSGINEKEYDRAIKVWKVCKIKTLGEYHNLWLKPDVLFLTDVFEKFIRTCLNYYSSDPSHYFSSPGLSFDAMLKMSGIKLDLISDINVHLFIEKEMKGGISYIAKRHSKINDCDSEEKKSTIYWDMNNLYGFAMIQPMPWCDFDFLTKKEINKFCLDSVSENSTIGYIL